MQRLRPAACLVAASAAAWAAAARPAAAADPIYQNPGGQLTPTSFPNIDSDTQHQIAGGPAVGLGGQPDPGWTILPRIDVSEAFNDNIFQQQNHPQSDFITYITPSVQVTGNLPRLQTRIFYAPTGVIYASHSNQDIVAQNLNGNATATVVPDVFYIDLRAYAAVRPSFGSLPGAGGSGFGITSGNSFGTGSGYASSTSPYLNRSNATQTESFTFAPYVVHRFGTFGTVKAGYSYSYSASQALSNAGFFPGGSSSNNANGNGIYGANGTVNTNAEVLQFTSGEDFGRFRDLAIAAGTQYSGSGVTQGAYQYIVSNQLGYAVTRQVTVFGEIGFEDVHFAGIPATTIEDATWAAGVTYTPNPDSTITVGYGRKYGIDAFLMNAGYSPTARTRLFANYQTGLGTDLTQLQSFTVNTDTDQYGNSVDPTTGAPLYLNNYTLGFTGNNTVYRSKTFSFGGIYNLDRDQFSLQGSWQDRQTVASTLGLGATSSSGFSALAGWVHQLSPDTTTNVNVSYGRQDGNPFFAFGAREVDETFSAQGAVKYNFTETLSGIAQYTFINRSSNFPGLSFTQNLFLLGLSKAF